MITYDAPDPTTTLRGFGLDWPPLTIRQEIARGNWQARRTHTLVRLTLATCVVMLAVAVYGLAERRGASHATPPPPTAVQAAPTPTPPDPPIRQPGPPPTTMPVGPTSPLPVAPSAPPPQAPAAVTPAGEPGRPVDPPAEASREELAPPAEAPASEPRPDPPPLPVPAETVAQPVRWTPEWCAPPPPVVWWTPCPVPTCRCRPCRPFVPQVRFFRLRCR